MISVLHSTSFFSQHFFIFFFCFILPSWFIKVQASLFGLDRSSSVPVNCLALGMLRSGTGAAGRISRALHVRAFMGNMHTLWTSDKCGFVENQLLDQALDIANFLFGLDCKSVILKKTGCCCFHRNSRGNIHFQSTRSCESVAFSGSKQILSVSRWSVSAIGSFRWCENSSHSLEKCLFSEVPTASLHFIFT